jgi:hypothetical protein
VELLVDWDGHIRPVRISYDGGLRYLALVPTEGETDLLREIASPRTIPAGDLRVPAPDAE